MRDGKVLRDNVRMEEGEVGKGAFEMLFEDFRCEQGVRHSGEKPSL